MTADYQITGSPVLSRLSQSTGLIVIQASDLFAEIFEAALKRYGLRAKEFAVLTAIQSMGPQSQQQLAQTLGIDRTTMVSVIDVLERLDLVDRVRDAEDRRKYAVNLTGQGQELLQGDLARAMLESLDAFLSPLSPDERAQFHKLLWRIVNERSR